MKTENKIEVKKIDIKIGDKTISLKPEQAKELKKILNEMFEESKVVHEHHYSYPYYWNWPYQWTYTIGGTHFTSSLNAFTGGSVGKSHSSGYSYSSLGNFWSGSSNNSGNVTLCLNAA